MRSGWPVRPVLTDLGSRNGTDVNGVRVAGTVAVGSEAVAW
ncbi:MAG TPA: FHA domain-containing protein [Streptosporangiaceae bacterium]|nr:FHA domain-containing protein [Streptosporangiaceae bacterium]